MLDLGLLNFSCQSNGKAHTDAHEGHDTSSSRPAEDGECLIRGWKAEEFAQLSWPNIAPSVWDCGGSQVDIVTIKS